MTIEEFIPTLDDIYEDNKGLHIDINLLNDCIKNYALYEHFSKENKIISRIKELYDLSDYECVFNYMVLGCYLTTIWERKKYDD